VSEPVIKLQERVKDEADEIMAIRVVIGAKPRLPHNAIVHQQASLLSSCGGGSIMRVVASKRSVEEIESEITNKQHPPCNQEYPFASRDPHNA